MEFIHLLVQGVLLDTCTVYSFKVLLIYWFTYRT